MSDEPSNLQRAFWTALGYLLVGPFLSGLGIAIILILAQAFKLQELLPAGLGDVGSVTLATFVWSVLPCAVAAIFLMPFIFRRGTIGWIETAVAGVIAFAVVVIFSNMPHRDYLPALAFFAGLVSLGVRQALIAGNILKQDM